MLYGKYQPELVNIPAVDEIYDKKTKKNRLIRYVPGESSIYASDQADNAEDRTGEIVFIHGMKAVPKTANNLLTYLETCNYNNNNKDRVLEREILFAVHNPEGEAEAKYDKEMEKLNVRKLIQDMKEEEAIAIASVYKLDTTNSIKSIKWSLLQIATNERDINAADRFLKHLQNPDTKRLYVVLSAIDKNVLIHDTTQNTLSWATGGTIIKGNVGEDVIEGMIHYANTEDGLKVYQAMYDKLYPTEKYAIVSEPPVAVSDVVDEPEVKEKEEKEKDEPLMTDKIPDGPTNYTVNEEDYKESEEWKFILNAIKEGYVNKQGNYYSYNKYKGMGPKGLLKHFAKDSNDWEELKEIMG
jgi:cyclophilin family peptidyl-prolyl cis-trans isomerase